VNFVLVGHGRMGRSIERLAVERGHRMIRAFDASSIDQLSRSSLADAEVAFEFTKPDAAEQNVHTLLELGVAVVCGTTGWEAGRDLEHAAKDAGLIVAPNFSVGMNLFYRLVREAGRLYGRAGLHQPYVLESHHRGKRDVPSGTARRLASILIEADGRLNEMVEGNPARPLEPGALQVASVRAGTDPGTHTVGFDGEHDRIVLQHAARSPTGFALGAVIAAEWLRGRSGMHGFEEVLDAGLDRE